MKCDICGREFANSEEMNAHKEREHPVDDSDDDDLEAPDMIERPEPVVRPAR